MEGQKLDILNTELLNSRYNRAGIGFSSDSSHVLKSRSYSISSLYLLDLVLTLLYTESFAVQGRSSQI